jgi:hypothetical protein
MVLPHPVTRFVGREQELAALGVRYGYNPVVTEGEDALPEGEYEVMYRPGSRLEFPDLFALLESLPSRALPAPA